MNPVAARKFNMNHLNYTVFLFANRNNGVSCGYTTKHNRCMWKSRYIASCEVNQKRMQCELLLYACSFSHAISFCECRMR